MFLKFFIVLLALFATIDAKKEKKQKKEKKASGSIIQKRATWIIPSGQVVPNSPLNIYFYFNGQDEFAQLDDVQLQQQLRVYTRRWHKMHRKFRSGDENALQPRQFTLDTVKLGSEYTSTFAKLPSCEVAHLQENINENDLTNTRLYRIRINVPNSLSYWFKKTFQLTFKLGNNWYSRYTVLTSPPIAIKKDGKLSGWGDFKQKCKGSMDAAKAYKRTFDRYVKVKNEAWDAFEKERNAHSNSPVTSSPVTESQIKRSESSPAVFESVLRAPSMVPPADSSVQAVADSPAAGPEISSASSPTLGYSRNKGY